MPLPEKLFFELGECADRWHVTMGDVQYYITHGYLEAQAWVPLTDVEFCRMDGETGQVRSWFMEHQGYAALFPETCRRIFSQLGCMVFGFRMAGSEDFFKLPQSGLMVRPADLYVSREELQRFEQAYDLTSPAASPGRAGRPSVMDKIMVELQRRIETGKDMKSNNAEAEHLYRWAEATIRDRAVPSIATIANNVGLFRKKIRQNPHAIAS
jgi:hypothetical protein